MTYIVCTASPSFLNFSFSSYSNYWNIIISIQVYNLLSSQKTPFKSQPGTFCQTCDSKENTDLVIEPLKRHGVTNVLICLPGWVFCWYPPSLKHSNTIARNHSPMHDIVCRWLWYTSCRCDQQGRTSQEYQSRKCMKTL